MEVTKNSEEISLEVLEDIKNKGKLYFDESIAELYHLEKKYREQSDAISIGKILVVIVQLLFEQHRLIELNENILNFATKKHLQSEHAIGVMVKECCKFIDEISEEEEQVKLMETIRLVTRGKLFAEMERSQISKRLAVIKKTNGNPMEAIKILEDLKIDTLATLDRKERMEIILQLMDLLVETKDFTKCMIIAKKINVKHFECSTDYQLLKIRYYRLMIAMDKDENYLNTSRHYQALLETDFIKSHIEERQKFLKLAVIYCVLSPYDNEKSDMMERLLKHEHIKEVNLFYQLLKEFIKIEIIDWYAMKTTFKDQLLQLGIFDVSHKEGLKSWKNLRTSTIEHNIRVFASYYSRAYLTNMSELLYINRDETEKHLSNLIVNKTIKAKIDRVSGIVSFNQCVMFNEDQRKISVCEQKNTLQSWLQQVSTIMKLVDNTSHLINKELEL
ncbi:unnamed protein product [Diamesa tonsa]